MNHKTKWNIECSSKSSAFLFLYFFFARWMFNFISDLSARTQQQNSCRKKKTPAAELQREWKQNWSMSDDAMKNSKMCFLCARSHRIYWNYDENAPLSTDVESLVSASAAQQHTKGASKTSEIIRHKTRRSSAHICADGRIENSLNHINDWRERRVSGAGDR